MSNITLKRRGRPSQDLWIFDRTLKPLMREIQQYPILYDRNHENYCKREYVNIAWKKIGKTLNLDALKCKNMYHKMRNRYNFERRRILLQQITTSSWKLFEDMKFLDAYMVTRNPASEIVPQSDANNSNANDSLDNPSFIVPGISHSNVNQTEPRHVFNTFGAAPNQTVANNQNNENQEPMSAPERISKIFGRFVANNLEHMDHIRAERAIELLTKRMTAETATYDQSEDNLNHGINN